MKPFFLIAFLITAFCSAQDDALLHIIDSDISIEEKEHQIDSLLSLRNQEQPTELLADFYHDLASKWFLENWWDSENQEDLDNALVYAHKAYDIKKKLPSLKKSSLEKTLFNLGHFNYLNNDLYEAIDFFLLLITTGKDTRLIQKANLDLGKIYMYLGDFYKALDRFNAYTTHYNSNTILNNREKISIANVYILKANVFSQMGMKQYAADILLNLSNADKILKKTNNNDTFYKNKINQLKGNLLLRLGYYTNAIAHHKKVINDSINLYPDEMAFIYSSLGLSQIRIEDYNNALFNLKKAISYDNNFTDSYENLGDLYLKQNQFKKALFYYQKAMVMATHKKEVLYDGLLTTQDLELAAEKVFLLNHIITKANGWLAYYKYNKQKSHLINALKTFTLADQLVDIIRTGNTEYQSKLFWREKGASLYMKAVEVCHLLDKPQEAFRLMERNKALLLLEDVSKEMAQLPKNLLKQEYTLKQNIYLSENELQITESQTDSTVNTLKNSIYKHKQAYESFVDSVSLAFPKYANLNKKVDVLSFQNFKETCISKEEVVLQYIMNKEQGYGLLSTLEKTILFKIENVESLNTKIIELYGLLTDITANKEKIARYNTLSNTVFKTLIPSSIYENIQGKKVTIISDYSLQQIPLEALVTNVDKSTYLIEDAEIQYAYSMSYLNAKKEITTNAEKKLLGIAPITFTNLKLPKLVFSGDEVRGIHKLYQGDILLDTTASKSKLLPLLNNYKIIHLSTHADAGEDGNPWIAFSDEKLFLKEIYATKNQADMVVLSACNTSIGELKKGEGVMSLARGFFHSGAKSVVSSLWTINDKSSKDIMLEFYNGLEQGLTKSAAMQNAKINYIKKYRTTLTPSYWAGLIVIGDNAPIENNTFNWIWVLIPFMAIVIIFFYYRFNKSKK
ncbi:CHAT domain-containing protein [Maribacter vaceletii]|uniref:CHAT domain-containing protein n=1 Tax=Maribacter vaceletii TaxID=1206816 RepID=A0A495EF76_9FLAO|nr:CHAT domain-containing protein [Maribacter vaceletii]RKR15416.1 CHAT domain-containing protein [Maribacter vaceletii]